MGEIQTTADGRPYWERFGYKDANTVVKTSLRNGCRAVIAMGYYLKHIRENGLYQDGGYKSFGEYVRTECGLSETAASRSISQMERFSEGGNSPNLAKKWEAFSASKLQEILYLTDEQAENVRPEMTVKEIREIRKPEEIVVTVAELPAEPKEAPPGLAVIEGNIEDILPDVPKPEVGGFLWAEEKYLRRLADLLMEEVGPHIAGRPRPYWRIIDPEFARSGAKRFADEQGQNGHISLGDDIEVIVTDREGGCGLHFYRMVGNEDLGISSFIRLSTQMLESYKAWQDKQDAAEKEVAIVVPQETTDVPARGATGLTGSDAGGTPLDGLDLNIRTYNVLRRAGVDTVEELRALTDDDLMRVRNMSAKCIQDIKAALGEPSVEKPEEFLATSQKTGEEKPEGTMLWELDLKQGTYNSLRAAGIDMIGGLKHRLGQESLSEVKGIGQERAEEIGEALREWEKEPNESAGTDLLESKSNASLSGANPPDPEQKELKPDRSAVNVFTYDGQLLREMIEEENSMAMMERSWEQHNPLSAARRQMRLEAYQLLLDKYKKEEEDAKTERVCCRAQECLYCTPDGYCSCKILWIDADGVCEDKTCNEEWEDDEE